MQPRECGRYLAHLVVQSSISQGFLVPQTFSILQIAKKGNKSDRNYLGETPLLEKKKNKIKSTQLLDQIYITLHSVKKRNFLEEKKKKSLPISL